MSRPQVILIVEDDVALRGMWRTALRLEGFVVVEAGDGLEALKLIEADPPDLVVLDIGLPHVDGIAVRKDLAAQVYSRKVPIVVITGLTEDLSYLDVNCILKKPVTVDHVVLVIEDALSGTSRASAFSEAFVSTDVDGDPGDSQEPGDEDHRGGLRHSCSPPRRQL